MNRDELFMAKALALAAKGQGSVSPNPLVGALVVKNNKIISQGFHKKPGSDHAEIVALKKVGKKAKGATLYVTLEPCSHFGRTPPCTNAIAKAGISRVVIANKDPNPKVKGIQALKKNKIKVTQGILSAQEKELNEFYHTFHKKKRPFIILKAATTLDGHIATQNGDSKYISSKESRKVVHTLRSIVDAIIIGVNTVIKDDPLLTTRLVKGRSPRVVILDSQLNTPLKCKLLKDPKRITILTTKKSSVSKRKVFEKKGVSVHVLPNLSIKTILASIHKQQVTSVLVEGGSKVFTSFIKSKQVDELQLFIAPKILGKGISIFDDLGIKHIKNTLPLDIQSIDIHDDIHIVAALK